MPGAACAMGCSPSGHSSERSLEEGNLTHGPPSSQHVNQRSRRVRKTTALKARALKTPAATKLPHRPGTNSTDIMAGGLEEVLAGRQTSSAIKRTAITRAGYEYQDLAGIELLIKHYRDPDLYDWVMLEADDTAFRSLDDVVAA